MTQEYFDINLCLQCIISTKIVDNIPDHSNSIKIIQISSYDWADQDGGWLS